VFSTINRVPIIWPIIALVNDCFVALACCNGGVERVLHASSGVRDSAFACIICGTIAGSAGGILINMLNLAQPDYSFQTPRQLRSVPLNVKLCFAVSSIYYLCMNPHSPRAHHVHNEFGLSSVLHSGHSKPFHVFFSSALMSPENAKFFAVCIFVMIGFVRTHFLDWSNRTLASSPASSEKRPRDERETATATDGKAMDPSVAKKTD